jgi:ribosomal-protein-alanine N-acetyltransferase
VHRESLESFATERLVARRLRFEDLDDWSRLYGDPEVTASVGGVRSTHQAHRAMMMHLRRWVLLGFGMWMFRARADGRFVGQAGLWKAATLGLGGVELGYGLVPESWGRGFATEMSRAVAAIGFALLGIGSLGAVAPLTHQASRRVLEKVGFRFERETLRAAVPYVVYHLSASDWTSRGAESA